LVFSEYIIIIITYISITISLSYKIGNFSSQNIKRSSPHRKYLRSEKKNEIKAKRENILDIRDYLNQLP
jgi:hypothetical protein